MEARWHFSSATRRATTMAPPWKTDRFQRLFSILKFPCDHMARAIIEDYSWCDKIVVRSMVNMSVCFLTPSDVNLVRICFTPCDSVLCDVNLWVRSFTRTLNHPCSLICCEIFVDLRYMFNMLPINISAFLSRVYYIFNFVTKLATFKNLLLDAGWLEVTWPMTMIPGGNQAVLKEALVNYPRDRLLLLHVSWFLGSLELRLTPM